MTGSMSAALPLPASVRQMPASLICLRESLFNAARLRAGATSVAAGRISDPRRRATNPGPISPAALVVIDIGLAPVALERDRNTPRSFDEMANLAD